MGKSQKNRDKSGRITLLRQQYEAFLEEDRKRRERNEYILQKLDIMRSTTVGLQPNTDMGKHLNGKQTVSNIEGMPQFTMQGFIPKFRTHIPSDDAYNFLPTPYKNQMIIPKYIAPNQEENIEQTILREISKKYILIPKLMSPVKENVITLPNNQTEEKTRAENEWKSKYDILEKLGSINDGDESLDISKKQKKTKAENGTTDNYQRYVNCSDKEQENGPSDNKTHKEIHFTELNEIQDSLQNEQQRNSSADNLKKSKIKDITGINEDDYGPALEKSSYNGSNDKKTPKGMTNESTENVRTNIEINDQIIDSVKNGQSYNRSSSGLTAVLSNIENTANVFKDDHPYKIDKSEINANKNETSSVNIAVEHAASINNKQMFDKLPEAVQVVRETDIGVPPSSYENVHNLSYEVDPNKYETEDQHISPETNVARNNDTANYLHSKNTYNDTQYTNKLPQNQGYTQDHQQYEVYTQEQVYNQDNGNHGDSHQNTGEYGKNQPFQNDVQPVYKETSENNDHSFDQNEKSYEQNPAQVYEEEHALTYPQKIPQVYDQSSRQVFDLEHVQSENPPTDFQKTAEVVDETQPYQNDQGWNEQNVAEMQQPIPDSIEYQQSDQYSAEIAQDVYGDQEVNAYANQTAYPVEQYEQQYGYDQTAMSEVAEYDPNQTYDQTLVPEGTEQVYDQNQGYDQTIVPEGTGQGYEQTYEQTQDYDYTSTPQATEQLYEQPYAPHPNQIEDLADNKEIQIDLNYNEHGYEENVQQEGITHQAGEGQGHVEQQHEVENQNQYEYTEQPVENTSAQ